MRRVIVLPERGTKPYFAWLKVPEGSDAAVAGAKRRLGPEMDKEYGVPLWESEEVFVFPEGEEIFGTKLAHPRFVDLVCGKLGSGERLDHSIHLFKRDTAFGSVANRCLARLKKGEAGIGGRYPGPLVFVGMTKVSQPSITVNVDTADFALALDAITLRDRMMETGAGIAEAMATPKKRQGVKVSSVSPFFEAVNVPTRHPVYVKAPSLPLAKLMGIDLLIHTYRPAATTTSSPAVLTSAVGEPNDPASYLFIDIDKESSLFGTIPAMLEKSSTSLLVAAAGQSSLNPDMLAKFCDFIKTDVLEVINRVALTPEQRPEVLVNECGKKAEEVLPPSKKDEKK